MYRTEAAGTSRRRSNSNRWVSRRVYLICASRYPKGLYCGLYIEMKFGDNRQQETQKEFLSDMAAAGHFVATCYSAEEAVKVIEEYCELMNHKMGDSEIVIPLENREALRNITMSIPNNSILKNGEIKESKPRKK